VAITYTQLSSLIQNYTQNFGSEFVATIPSIVQQAEDRIYKAVQIPALKKNQQANVSIGVKYLTLPTDFLATYSVAITVSGSQFYLLEREVSWLGEAMQGVAQGAPRYYALFDQNTFLLGPTPGVAYPVELHYFYEPQSIVTASTSWLGDNAESVLLYGCLLEAYTYMKGDSEILTFYKSRYDDALGALKVLGEGYNKRDNLKQDLPRVAPR
jgi:hypothetical protein